MHCTNNVFQQVCYHQVCQHIFPGLEIYTALVKSADYFTSQIGGRKFLSFMTSLLFEFRFDVLRRQPDLVSWRVCGEERRSWR